MIEGWQLWIILILLVLLYKLGKRRVLGYGNVEEYTDYCKHCGSKFEKETDGMVTTMYCPNATNVNYEIGPIEMIGEDVFVIVNWIKEKVEI